MVAAVLLPPMPVELLRRARRVCVRGDRSCIEQGDALLMPNGVVEMDEVNAVDGDEEAHDRDEEAHDRYPEALAGQEVCYHVEKRGRRWTHLSGARQPGRPSRT